MNCSSDSNYRNFEQSCTGNSRRLLDAYFSLDIIRILVRISASIPVPFWYTFGSLPPYKILKFSFPVLNHVTGIEFYRPLTKKCHIVFWLLIAQKWWCLFEFWLKSFEPKKLTKCLKRQQLCKQYVVTWKLNRHAHSKVWAKVRTRALICIICWLNFNFKQRIYWFYNAEKTSLPILLFFFFSRLVFYFNWPTGQGY